MLKNYAYITPQVLAYFDKRLTPGAARRELRSRLCQARSENAGATAGGHRCADLQMRHAVGDARCALFRLCRARPDAARRIRAQGHAEMSAIADTARPRLPAGVGCRTTGRAIAGSCWRRNGCSNSMKWRGPSGAVRRRARHRRHRRCAGPGLPGRAFRDHDRCEGDAGRSRRQAFCRAVTVASRSDYWPN